MRFEVHHYHHIKSPEYDDIVRRLGIISRQVEYLTSLTIRDDKHMSDISDKLDAEVNAVIGTMTKAQSDIATISQNLTDALANNDSGAMQRAIDQLEPVRVALDTAASPSADTGNHPIVDAAAAVTADAAPADPTS